MRKAYSWGDTSFYPFAFEVIFWRKVNKWRKCCDRSGNSCWVAIAETEGLLKGESEFWINKVWFFFFSVYLPDSTSERGKESFKCWRVLFFSLTYAFLFREVTTLYLFWFSLHLSLNLKGCKAILYRSTAPL